MLADDFRAGLCGRPSISFPCRERAKRRIINGRLTEPFRRDDFRAS